MQTLSEMLRATINEVSRKLGEPAPPGMPSAGVYLTELEARLLLAAAQSTLERLREMR